MLRLALYQAIVAALCGLLVNCMHRILSLATKRALVLRLLIAPFADHWMFGQLTEDWIGQPKVRVQQCSRELINQGPVAVTGKDNDRAARRGWAMT